MVSKRRTKIITAVIVFVAFFALTFMANAEQGGVRCHRCKERDIELIFKHKQLGYDGCFVCHKETTSDKDSSSKKTNKRKK
jgi:hypothetical protein